MPKPAKHVGVRRSSGWWEPTHNPALLEEFVECEWLAANSTGPERGVLSVEDLAPTVSDGKPVIIEGRTFVDCDIQGSVPEGLSVAFRDCTFLRCDFGYSNWQNTIFRSCTIHSCSLSLSTFTSCEFRDCSWMRTGFSGSKTGFDKTLVNNPIEFLESGFSGLNPALNDVKSHRSKQAYRLEETKAHLSRVILFSNKEVADDRTFYQSTKYHDIQQVKSRFFESIHFLRYGDISQKKRFLVPLASSAIEFALVSMLGPVNGWGASQSRPIIGLIVTFVVFGLLYTHFSFGIPISHAWQKSFDISNIAGYGNQVKDDQPLFLRRIEALQLCLSIVFYTVFFSTAVARNSRVR